MKSKEDLTQQEDKIWEYMTRRKHEKGTPIVSVFHLADHFSTTDEKMQQILESMAEAKIISIPPNWGMMHDVTLKEERWVAEEGSITDEEPKNQSPPPPQDKDLDEILAEMTDKHKDSDKRLREKQERMKFNNLQSEEARKRKYQAAKAHAKDLIKRYNLKSDIEFRECQVCHKAEAEIYIPNPEYPLLVNVLCHSHLMKEVNDPSNLPTVSIREKIEEHIRKTDAYSKKRIYRNKLKNANSVKKTWRNRFKDMLPTLHCAACGVSEEEKRISLRIVDPDNPYRVIPLCSKCMQKYIHDKDVSTFNTQDLRHLDLVELVGIHVVPDLYYYEAEILSVMRRGRSELACYVCGIPLEESELYLDRIDENGFYLTCPDCMKTAKVDLLSGFGKPPTMVDLRGLNL